MKLRNLLLVLKDQLPFQRLLRNCWNGNIRGLFSRRSHMTMDNKEKVKYTTKSKAIQAAAKMSIKNGVYFSNYKCLFCDGYHIGKNHGTKIVQQTAQERQADEEKA